ncbi:hypothetical protein GCM10010964_00150 [Caldovatus sediminis]|uniref:Uncharacterized protein n=1 Tax=Caldovatus sediminis TaxID=2041189 RepID=A0A8J2Z7G8_9PROT|nr:hypothetical protein GCM10010964_00150 [Caldovatus sediminis]
MFGHKDRLGTTARTASAVASWRPPRRATTAPNSAPCRARPIPAAACGPTPPAAAGPAHLARGTPSRAPLRRRVEHVFPPRRRCLRLAAGKRRLDLVVRRIGPLRATVRITLANQACARRRLIRIEGQAVPA